MYHSEVLWYWREVPRLILFNHTSRRCTFTTLHAPWIRPLPITIFPACLIVWFTMKHTNTSPTWILPSVTSMLNSKAKQRMTHFWTISQANNSKSPHEQDSQRGLNSQSDHYIHGRATWLPILNSCLQCPHCWGLCTASSMGLEWCNCHCTHFLSMRSSVDWLFHPLWSGRQTSTRSQWQHSPSQLGRSSESHLC